MSIRQQAVQGYKWNLISAILAVVFQGLQVYYTAKFLTPEDFGIWGIVVLISGFVVIFNDVGIGGAIIHHQDLPRQHLSSLYWLTVFVGVAIAVLIVLFIPAIEYFFKVEDIAIPFLILAFSVIIISFGKQYEVLLQKELRFKQSSIIDSVSSLLGFISVIVLLNSGYKVGALVLGFLINSATKTALLVYWGLSAYRPSLYFKASDLKKYISFGLFQLGGKNVSFFSERFDQIIIGRILGAGQLGLYSFAFNLVYQPVSKVNPIINKISLPVFAKIQSNNSEVKSVYFKKLTVLTYANAAILLGMFAIAHPLILYFFGEKWEESIIIFQLLSVVFLFKSIWNPIGSVLFALGKASVYFYWNIFFVVVSVPMILASSWGGDINYVGFCLIGAQLLLFVPNYYFLVRPALGDCFRELINSLTRPLLISASMCVVVSWVGEWLKSEWSISLGLLMIQILAGVLTQFLLMWIFDRKSLGEIISFIKSNRKR